MKLSLLITLPYLRRRMIMLAWAIGVTVAIIVICEYKRIQLANDVMLESVAVDELQQANQSYQQQLTQHAQRKPVFDALLARWPWLGVSRKIVSRDALSDQLKQAIKQFPDIKADITVGKQFVLNQALKTEPSQLIQPIQPILTPLPTTSDHLVAYEMQFSADIVHEARLLALQQYLDQVMQALVVWRGCNITRLDRRGEADRHQLKVMCHLWLFVRGHSE